jgi:excisionase family DNA binding protein
MGASMSLQNDAVQRTYRTVPEVAQMIQISQRQVRALINQGELPAFKFGREYRVKEAELEAWIEDHRISSHKEVGARNQ